MVKTIYAALLLPFLLWGCGNDSSDGYWSSEQREASQEINRRCEEATGSKCSGSLAGSDEADAWSTTSSYSCTWRKRDGISCSW